jgi:hypothetical protein
VGNVLQRPGLAAIAPFYYSRPSYESRIDLINLFRCSGILKLKSFSLAIWAAIRIEHKGKAQMKNWSSGVLAAEIRIIPLSVHSIPLLQCSNTPSPHGEASG